MGLFGLWKSNDNSAATFEKTLSQLSAKISKATSHDTQLRTRSRRLKALWTLYTSFVYIVYALISLLVTGWQRWGTVEWTAMASGPVAIVGVRTLISTYYTYRLSSNDARLTDLRRQKAEAIDKFKEATKYNSTQQLLEKYGAEPKPTDSGKDSSKGGAPSKKKSSRKSAPAAGQTGMTNLPPPRTANIAQQGQDPVPLSPQQQRPMNVEGWTDTAAATVSGVATARSPVMRPPSSPQTTSHGFGTTPSEEFAPNAEAVSTQYVTGNGIATGKWYDRVMDLLLGEDETRPANRLVLICSNCRLINGQAPPGVKRLEELGRWRCFECRSWNGEENEVAKILDTAAKDDVSTPKTPHIEEPSEGAMTEHESTQEHVDVKKEDEESIDLSKTPAASTRSRVKENVNH